MGIGDWGLGIGDTQGEKKYRDKAKIIYLSVDAIILAYDITRKETFSEIKNYWYPEIKKNCESDPSKIH